MTCLVLLFSILQEVENYATVKVQHCLDDLEDYLLTGRHSSGDRCFDIQEANQWRGLIIEFKYVHTKIGRHA